MFYERLSGLDHSFLVMEGPDTHMHIAAVMVLEVGPLRGPEGGIDFGRIRDSIASRLHLVPRYRQRLARVPLESRPVWVDDEHFNLHYHLRHTSLPKPGSERQLKRLAGRVMSQQLDRSRPLWEIWVVEGLAGDRFALLSKVHHCMIDGVAGVDLFELLLDPRSEEDDRDEPPVEWTPRPAPAGLALLADALLRRAVAPIDVARGLRTGLQHLDRLRAELADRLQALSATLGEALRPTSDTPLNRPVGPHRRIEWLTVDLDQVKGVKDRLGGTVNDVVLATVSGAVRRYLEARGVAVDELKFRVLAPVSTRRRGERGTLGNRISAWLVDLPVAERDPVRTLELVRLHTAELKQRHSALGAEMLAGATEWTGSTLLSLGLQLVVRVRPFNLVVTNVPGPQIPLYLCGARLLASYPLVPLFQDQALGVALFSYDGRVHFGLNGEWERLPDLHEFRAALEASFEELRTASPSRRSAKRKRRATRRATRPRRATSA